MNEFFTMASVGLVAGVAFFLYNLRVGFNANLTEAKEGEVYRFEYLQPVTGKAERYMVKILDSYTLSSDAIARLNKRSGYRKNDPNFMRTAHLVTGQCGDGTIRNFYAERTRNVRRPLLGGVMFKTGLASLLF